MENVPAKAGQPGRRDLLNGTIVHGIEILEPERQDEATTYYGPASGAAIALNAAHSRGNIHAGVISLGAGTLATYGKAGDRFTFTKSTPS